MLLAVVFPLHFEQEFFLCFCFPWSRCKRPEELSVVGVSNSSAWFGKIVKQQVKAFVWFSFLVFVLFPVGANTNGQGEFWFSGVVNANAWFGGIGKQKVKPLSDWAEPSHQLDCEPNRQLGSRRQADLAFKTEPTFTPNWPSFDDAKSHGFPNRHRHAAVSKLGLIRK